MALYFGPEVDVKIIEWKATDDIQEKHRIFDTHIRPALTKLIESQIYLYRFYTIDDPDLLKNECLSNLYEVLPKFDPSKGKKAFSYFNVVSRNWFIWKTREKKKRLKMEANNFYGIDHEVVRNDPSILTNSHQDEVIEKEFMVSLFRDMEVWRSLLKKPQEIKVLEAIVFLLQNPQLISIYNKKAVFLYIREMTNLTPKQLNHNMNKLKELYVTFRERFNNGEEEECG